MNSIKENGTQLVNSYF